MHFCRLLKVEHNDPDRKSLFPRKHAQGRLGRDQSLHIVPLRGAMRVFLMRAVIGRGLRLPLWQAHRASNTVDSPEHNCPMTSFQEIVDRPRGQTHQSGCSR